MIERQEDRSMHEIRSPRNRMESWQVMKKSNAGENNHQTDNPLPRQPAAQVVSNSTQLTAKASSVGSTGPLCRSCLLGRTTDRCGPGRRTTHRAWCGCSFRNPSVRSSTTLGVGDKYHLSDRNNSRISSMRNNQNRIRNPAVQEHLERHAHRHAPFRTHEESE